MQRPTQPPRWFPQIGWHKNRLCRSLFLPSMRVEIGRDSQQDADRLATAIDYDKTEIAATYDQARMLYPETVRLWQDLLSVHIDRAAISQVIDLGCGTGRFSEL